VFCWRCGGTERRRRHVSANSTSQYDGNCYTDEHVRTAGSSAPCICSTRPISKTSGLGWVQSLLRRASASVRSTLSADCKPCSSWLSAWCTSGGRTDMFGCWAVGLSVCGSSGRVRVAGWAVMTRPHRRMRPLARRKTQGISVGCAKPWTETRDCLWIAVRVKLCGGSDFRPPKFNDLAA
jgi:hypothetical protein